MQALIDFFKGFADIVASLVDFVIDFVGDLLYVIQLLGGLLPKIPDMISWLPSAVVSLIVLTFSIVLIYKIIGREG